MILQTAANTEIYTNGQTSGKEGYLGKHDSDENWQLVEEADIGEATEEDYITALQDMGVEV